jgi:16S rRNA (guanine(966)-N(2))-methyltransferase RsmD
MRITTGLYKGRVLKRVGTVETRETAGIVKQAVFNILFDVSDQIVLDVFAGSGQYGFEALSRGAKKAIFIDHQQQASMTILDNASMLQCQHQVEIFEQPVTQKVFQMIHDSIDTIFVDPPYDYQDYEKLLYIMPKAKQVIIETQKKTQLKDVIGSYQKVKEKLYGIKKIFLYELL